MMKESVEAPLETGAPPSHTADFHFGYSTVTGYFLQDEPDTDPDTFDFKEHAFGLKPRSYESDSSLSDASSKSQWQRFQHHLESINDNAPEGTSYRLLFLARHGQGYHNVGQSFYGTVMWDCYWSTLKGNKTVTWADAHLTGIGKQQARDAHDTWKKTIADQGMKTPESFYVSPLDRAIETANITFTGVIEPSSYKSTVKEMLREGNGIHTCDRRSTRTAISTRWPTYTIEKGFTENDELWRPDLRESISAITERLRGLLDDVFAHDGNTWISITAHAGTTFALLAAIGHRGFPLQTGGVIPVLVKVEKRDGKRVPAHVDPWQPKPDCPSDPLHERHPEFGSFEEYWTSLGLEETQDPSNPL